MLALRGMHTAFRLITQSSKGRSIHIPVNLGRKPPLPIGGGSSGRNVINQVRNALNRLLYSGGPNPSAYPSRPVHRIPPIRNQLSLPARHALSRSFGAPYLPRPPAVQRGMTQVGLGTAKNFSTARPIFQSLVENVPITGRAMYEMDLDMKKKKGKRISGKRVKKENEGKRAKEMIKPTFDAAFDKYFSELPTSEVTTSLTVPLNPPTTPTSTDPIHRTLSTAREVYDIHSQHSTHALRISSLFLRLEQAKVWQRGAHYQAFGVDEDGHDPGSAICTSVRIVFKGWSKQMVRDVIGEAGQGWCILREFRTSNDAPISIESARAITPAPPLEYGHDFIMPTLEFSSTFQCSHPATPFSDMEPSFSDTVLSSPSVGYISLRSTDASVTGDSENESDWSVFDKPASLSGATSWRELAFSAEFMRGQEAFSNF